MTPDPSGLSEPLPAGVTGADAPGAGVDEVG